MSVQASYFDRLWTFAAHGRSTGRSSVAEALPDRLEADFTGNKELFSAEEYEDPAFSEALLGLSKAGFYCGWLDNGRSLMATITFSFA